jgi:hypothetical protein
VVVEPESHRSGISLLSIVVQIKTTKKEKGWVSKSGGSSAGMATGLLARSASDGPRWETMTTMMIYIHFAR